MAIDRDTFFAELDGLTYRQIEQRLPLFDSEQLSLVQEYIDRKTLEQIKAALQGDPERTQTTQTALAALRAASTANKKAMIALIFALGGWLAAIAASLAYLCQGMNAGASARTILMSPSRHLCCPRSTLAAQPA